MKLHDLLDEIMDSKSKVRILRALFRFPEREFTEREVAGMIGMSPNTVNLALADLRRTNVFLYKRLGRTHAYRCNPDSALFPLFTEMFAEERQVRQDMLDLLKVELRDAGTCILFGSYARNEESFDSDIDVLIITEKEHKAIRAADHLSGKLLRRFSIALAPVIISEKEFAKKRQKGFIREALTGGIVIVKGKLEI